MESTIGGTRRHIRDVGHELQRRGHEVHLAVSAERMPEFAEDVAELRGAGVEVHEIPMQRAIDPRADWRDLRALKRLLKSVRPEIVHTHSSKAGVLGRVASLQAGIGRRVHTPHTFAFLFDAMFSGPKRRLFRALEVGLAKRCSAVVAVSETEAETIRASGVVAPDRLCVVPNGIDPEPYRSASPVAPADLNARADELLVSVVGLLNVAKGQDLALRAIALPGLERVRLLIAGHGEEEAALRALAGELGVADRVTFLGWWRDVPGLLAASDALLLPSRWEGLPYIALEAMASGLPVVATPVDGARELISDGVSGFRAGAIDAESIAAALRQLIEVGPAGRAELGRAGAEIQAQRYSIASMVDGLEAVYARALDSPTA